MPLIVPGVTANNLGDSETQEWLLKLVGKTLTDGSSSETAFSKTDLPKHARIVRPGQMLSKDHEPARLNVILGQDGTVENVYHGARYTGLWATDIGKSSITTTMFKKEITSAPPQKLKTSVQRSLRQSLLATYPLLVPFADEVLPKKASLQSIKLPDRAVLYVLDREPLFFESGKPGDVPLLPHLRLVHRFPQAFPSIRIDRGAIRYVLGGATLMAPGLTSPGGRLPDPRTLPDDREAADDEGRWSRELQKGEPVVITAEGKLEACAVGLLVAGTKDVKDKGKGPVVEDAHFLGDGLWRLPD